VAQAARLEIERFAEKSFGVVRDELLDEHSKKEKVVLGRTRLGGNSAAYLPALIECEMKFIRKLILAWAKVYAETFTLYGLPTDGELDEALKKFGQQTAAGSISGIRGQLRLRSMRVRTRKKASGVPWHLEIERATESAVKKGLVRLSRQRVELRNGSDFSQRVSKEDPNYELAQRFYLGAWADSHRLVADTLAGQVSFSEWVESCIKTFAQGAETQVSFVSSESIEEKCRELDRAADAFIHLFSEKVRATFKGRAQALGENAIEHLTCSVRGIASRSKQQIYESALKHIVTPSLQDGGRTDGSRSPGLKSHARNGEIEPQAPVAEEVSVTAAKDEDELRSGRAAKIARAATVAKLIKELNILKPQMLEYESEYNSLRGQYPDFLVFTVAETRPDLRTKILAIQGSTRHVRLAQELAAAYHGKSFATIHDDWKDHKPAEFRQQK
jgi:hypothetical protein